jgi:hypothetical protein
MSFYRNIIYFLLIISLFLLLYKLKVIRDMNSNPKKIYISPLFTNNTTDTHDININNNSIDDLIDFKIFQTIKNETKKNIVTNLNKLYPDLQNTYLLTLTHSRANYLSTSITSLLKLNGLKELSYVVSQDGYDPSIRKAILDYESLLKYKFKNFAFIQKPHLDHLSKSKNIASHYKFALDHIFYKLKAEKVILLEGKNSNSKLFFR